MSNLSNLIQGMLVNAIGQHSGSNNNTSNSGGLGGVLGGLLNGQNRQNNGNANIGGMGGGLGGMLGSVLGGLGGQNNNAQNQTQHQSGGLMGGKGKLLLVLVPFVLSWIQKQGGFHNAIKVLTQSGLGQQAQSWVSNNANEPVDASSIAKVFDDSEVEQVANQANTSKSEVYNTLADILPQMVNSITSNGQVQGNGSTNQIQQAMDMLGGLK